MKAVEEDPCPTARLSTSQVEQRRQPRYLSLENNIMRLAVRPEFRGRSALLVDVSATGIGFLLPEPLAPDTILVLELRGVNEADTVTRIAQVRHSCPHPVPENAPWLAPAPVLSQVFRRLVGSPAPRPLGEAWLVGCKFDKPLDEHEINRFLMQYKLQPGREWD